MVSSTSPPVRPTPSSGSYPREGLWAAMALAAFLIAAVCAVSLSAQAHLLNMSRMTVNLNEGRALSVIMELDLNDALGGAERYLAISKLNDPRNEEDLAALMRRLEFATRITIADQIVPVRVTHIVMPDVPDEDFLNPLIWPRTTIVLDGNAANLLIEDSEKVFLQGHLDTVFPFPEPIALAFVDSERDTSMTRWLAVRQKSPLFDGSRWWASSLAVTVEPSIELEIDWAEFRHYLVLGFGHILPGGADHMLFVLGLYLGAARIGALIALITTFTLAHSFTLMVSTLGLLRLPSVVIEPLIMASIVWIALENLLLRQHLRRKLLLVFGFGLLHGMGFAGALADIGLPESSFMFSMLSFNIGVEFGQITLLIVLLLLSSRFVEAPWYRRRVIVPGSILIGCIALVWSVQRFFY